jgi:hypothetical protein
LFDIRPSATLYSRSQLRLIAHTSVVNALYVEFISEGGTQSAEAEFVATRDDK